MKLSAAQEIAMRAVDAGTIFYGNFLFRQLGITPQFAKSREIFVRRPNTVFRALYVRGLIAFGTKSGGFYQVIRNEANR